jgi:arylsulfatase A-like enzyme
VLAATAALFGSGGCGGGESPLRSVLLVTLDTTRWDHVGTYGDPEARTPWVDALGRRGTIFENAFVEVPSTLPSHTSILTGSASIRHGVRMNGAFALDDAARTLPEVLAGAGLATAAVVSSITLAPEQGLSQGFGTYDARFRAPFTAVDPELTRRTARHASTQRRADETSAVALEILAELGHPCFLWVHYMDPHLTYDPPPPWNRIPLLTPYDGEIAFTDRQIGRVVRRVAERGDRVVIAIVADHGEGLGEHGQDGHGMFLYDNTVRVPLLVVVPGRAGGIVRELARGVDVAPTLESAAGLPPSDWPDGSDLLDPSAAHPARLLLETLTPTKKYGGAPLKAVRTRTRKYVRAPRPELYDLTRDPNERANLLPERADEIVAEERWLVEEVRRLSDPRRPAGVSRPVAVDPDRVEQLRALGYLVSSSDDLPSHELSREGLDPKDMIGVVLAHRYVLDGRWDEARERLSTYFAEASDPPAPGEEKLRSRALFGAAMLDRRDGHPDRARPKLSEALRLDPEFDAAREVLEHLESVR